MNKPMKPAFSYYGGKQRIASRIIPYIPKHTVYAEPFCGGATILFKKPWPSASNVKHYFEYINDTNEDVINFFRVLRDRGEDLCRMLECMPMSESEYRRAVEYRGDDLLLKAYYFYTNIQQSFTNQLSGGWRRGVFGSNQQAAWEKHKHLRKYVERMSSVGIACEEALDFIKRYDSPQTFFYCDPPYPNTAQGHYKGYGIDDFQNLVDTVKNIKGSAIISCYDAGLEMPSGWEAVNIESHCYSSGRGKVRVDRSRHATNEELGNKKRTEVIWIKQASQPRPEIQNLYDSGKFDCFQNKAYYSEDSIELTSESN